MTHRKHALLHLLSSSCGTGVRAADAIPDYSISKAISRSESEAPKQRHIAALQFFTSSAPALLRAGTAAFVAEGVQNFKRPAKLLELYEFQGEHPLLQQMT